MFLTLYENEWQAKVSSIAACILSEQKWNSPEVLPLTEDLAKLSKYLNTKLNEDSVKLRNKPDSSLWLSLCRATLARVILFNKRRAGEAAELRLEAYTGRPNWQTSFNEEISASLSQNEQELAKR